VQYTHTRAAARSGGAPAAAPRPLAAVQPAAFVAAVQGDDHNNDQHGGDGGEAPDSAGLQWLAISAFVPRGGGDYGAPSECSAKDHADFDGNPYRPCHPFGGVPCARWTYSWDADDAEAEPTAAGSDSADPAGAEPPTRLYESRLYESSGGFPDLVLGHRGDIRDSFWAEHPDELQEFINDQLGANRRGSTYFSSRSSAYYDARDSTPLAATATAAKTKTATSIPEAANSNSNKYKLKCHRSQCCE
jgi:hypothetical protein